MRVLHLISSSGLYGAEKMVTNLCRAQLNRGESPTLVVFRNAHSPNLEVADFAREQGVSVTLLDCGGRFDPRTVRQLRTQLQHDHFQILHTHGYKANLYGYLASRFLPITVVGTCHRFDQERQNVLDGPILRRFDGMAAVSDEAARSLESIYHLDPNVVTSIPNGIEIGITPTPTLAASSENGVLIGMVGRLAPEKAPMDFLTVAQHVHQSHPLAKFVVVGDGPMRSELETARDDLNLQDPIEFLGFREDVQEIYSQLSVLLQPSLREGMPMTTLEAMANSIAVVATRVGALPDVIADHQNGLLVDPGDIEGMTAAVRFLLDHEQEREALGVKAQETVRHSYGSASMADRYSDFYQRIATD